MKKILLLLILLAIALGIGWRFRSITAEEAAKAADKKGKPPVPVTVAEAHTADVPLLLSTPGRAEAYESVTLKSRIDGQVAGVEFTEGQPVRAGQVLIRLDPADFAAKLRQAEAGLARDEADLAKARADVARYQTLREQGFVSEEKLAELRAAAAAAAATAQAGRAALDLARLQLEHTVISAPFAGVVGARLVHPGSAVKVNDTELAVVNRVQPLYVSFAVPEKYLPRLRAAMGRGTLTVAARVPGDDRRGFAGTVRFLDNAVDAATGTIRLKAVLDNREEVLAAGQYLEVSLTLETLRDAVTVPAEAVQQGPEGSLVFVLRPDQTVETRPVRLATVAGGVAALGQGLKAGETVITDGHSRLTPGAKVKIKTPGGKP